MNSADVRKSLQQAAASSGEPDTLWAAAAVRRMYFHDPKNPQTSGAVDVEDDTGGMVKLDLWVPADLAAEIIARVTGRFSLRSEVPKPAPSPPSLPPPPSKGRAHVFGPFEAGDEPGKCQGCGMIYGAEGPPICLGRSSERANTIAYARSLAGNGGPASEELEALIASQAADADEDV